ncbi:MAG: hypothetical protein IPK48_06680 [Gammaproteobacteria bacterium]|nr:hypothetical protein [Gammaproteobacteria bacterium]
MQEVKALAGGTGGTQGRRWRNVEYQLERARTAQFLIVQMAAHRPIRVASDRQQRGDREAPQDAHLGIALDKRRKGAGDIAAVTATHGAVVARIDVQRLAHLARARKTSGYFTPGKAETQGDLARRTRAATRTTPPVTAQVPCSRDIEPVALRFGFTLEARYEFLSPD